ncbi:MAG: HAD family hydrolase [Eubacteriales bacterium]|nr:HAD family hydrolase [Eubacteriales bacterium]
MSIKLIAFDLDGTFLTTEKHIPAENMAAIELAASKGAVIVPASGRIFPGLPKELREAPYIRYYICGNGASVYDKYEDRILLEAEIPLELAVSFTEYMESLHVAFDSYMDNDGFINAEFYDTLDQWIFDPVMCAYAKSIRHSVRDLKELIIERGRSVQKLQLYFKDLNERDRQIALIPKLFPELIGTSSIANNIEVNSRLATKGQALSRLCEELNISPKDTLAFGDGTNDADMLVFAGVGAAMANAHPSLLEKADVIAPTNDECGVAAVIRKLIG